MKQRYIKEKITVQFLSFSQYDRVIAQFRSVIDMHPHFQRAMLIVYAYAEEGRFAEALDEAERRMRQPTTARVIVKLYSPRAFKSRDWLPLGR